MVDDEMQTMRSAAARWIKLSFDNIVCLEKGQALMTIIFGQEPIVAINISEREESTSVLCPLVSMQRSLF